MKKIFLIFTMFLLTACRSDQWARQTTMISIPRADALTSATTVTIDRQGLAIMGDAVNVAAVEQTSQSVKVVVDGSTGKSTLGAFGKAVIGAAVGIFSGGGAAGAAVGAALGTGAALVDKPKVPEVQAQSAQQNGKVQNIPIILDAPTIQLLRDLHARGALPAQLEECAFFRQLAQNIKAVGII